jgi:hypothetical protein
LQAEGLTTPEGIDAYQKYHALQPSNDLPGICRVSFLDLVERLDPPLPPRSEPNVTDTVYGHLHCSTACPDRLTMEKLAKLATVNGLLKPFVPAESHG